MKDLFFKTIMLKGEAGGTISKIEKTSSALNVDTYTITLNDGETQTFEVTNGSSIASIEKTDTSGLLDTYTVTLTDGSTTQFVVRNGEDGAGYEVPAGSVLFYDPDGDDSAPEGYEASSDPNGAAIAALQRGLDNNLLLHGDLMNIKSANYTYGWSFEKDAGTNMPGVWAPVNGLMIMAGVRGTLTAPRLTALSPFGDWFSSNTRFSVSVLFSFVRYPSGDPAPEPYYIAKIENIDPASLEGAVYTLENRVEIEVTQLAFGGLFKLHINNLSSSSYDIAIRAVKLELGPTATDIKYITPQTGLEDAIAQYIDVNTKGSIIETSLADLESTLISILESMSNEEVKIYYLFPNFSSSAFFGGAPQVAILTRRESGVYRVALPNICGDMYYYSGSWHYSKATMSSVTP